MARAMPATRTFTSFRRYGIGMRAASGDGRGSPSAILVGRPDDSRDWPAETDAVRERAARRRRGGGHRAAAGERRGPPLVAAGSAQVGSRPRAGGDEREAPDRHGDR